MTKQKAIRELVKLGWTLVDASKGQSSVELLSPVTSKWPNSRVVANAQDLLSEVQHARYLDCGPAAWDALSNSDADYRDRD